MSRRIDIELTSSRDDGSWTWRAVGAREPKGVLAADLLPAGAAVGDELRVEADFFVDGIEITSVLPAKGERKEPDFIEILGSGRDQGAGVTTSLVPKGRGRGDRGGRGRGERDGKGRGDRPGRGRGERSGGRGRSQQDRPPERPPAPAKPKPKKLRPQRTHRNAVLASLPEEQRPIAEEVLKGGIPGLRKAIEEQNTRNKAEGRPEIDPGPLVQLAETILPGLKEAEWHDRADAAIDGIAEIDLRDLRTVVVAAESNARSEQTRALAEQLRTALSGRVESEHANWLQEITEALGDERTVRALRMSSRPPKAGAPLPPELAARLTEAANAALTDDTGPQRWGTVLDAVAFSPVRSSVTPQGIPSRPNDELLETIKRLSTRIPEIAALFGIEPQKAPRRRRKPRSGGGGRSKGQTKDGGPAKKPPQAKSDESATDGTPSSDAAAPETPQAAEAPATTEAPAAVEAVAEVPGAVEAVAEAPAPEELEAPVAEEAAAGEEA